MNVTIVTRPVPGDPTRLQLEADGLLFRHGVPVPQPAPMTPLGEALKRNGRWFFVPAGPREGLGPDTLQALADLIKDMNA